jgi:DNA-directed RNA polymerase specialized sigma24 family protein
MTDSSQINSRKGQKVTREVFAWFLKSLSSDVEEAAHRYARLHKKLTGFFSLKGISDPVDAADETIDRAALKIASGTPVPDIERYCLGIARNVAKEKLRHALRESSTYLSFVRELPDSSDTQVERIQRILMPCFEQLAKDEKELLTRYCQVLHGRERAEHRRQLAEAMNTTVVALRMRVTRLRDILVDCAQKRAQQS